MPGAITLPVLSDDAERARVGTIYVQESPFLARKIGAALVARNIAAHIEGPLADRDGRLAAAGLLLARRPAVGELRHDPAPDRLAGRDGRRRLPDLAPAGAARALRGAAAAPADPARRPHRDRQDRPARAGWTGAGVQMLDLEGLARHRGSLLGAMPGGQPVAEGLRDGAGRPPRRARPRAARWWPRPRAARSATSSLPPVALGRRCGPRRASR